MVGIVDKYNILIFRRVFLVPTSQAFPTWANNSFHVTFTIGSRFGLASFAWMREMAHWADSEMTGSGDAASRVNTLDILWNAAELDGNFEFPSAMQMFRVSPCHLVLLIGLPRNISAKSL